MDSKRVFIKKSQRRLKTASETNIEKEAKKTPSINEQTLRATFEQCSDVVFSTLQFHQHYVTLVYCAGLVNNDMLYNIVPHRLEEYFQYPKEELTDKSLHSLQLPSLQAIDNIEKVENEIFSGKLLLIFKMNNMIYSVNISKIPNREPIETSMEVSIKGPRDNFIEDIVINHALIRKRLQTTSLISEPFVVGKRSKTKVSLLYVKDLADPNIIQEIRTKINAIDTDGIQSGTQLDELIHDKPYTLFPRVTYTGRPDFAVQSLLNGRFAILIDGVAYATIAPVGLFFLLKAAEDNEANFLYSSFERLIRVVGISVAVLLPGFWVGLTTFHQNQIPFTLLTTVIEARRGVPFPTSMEAMLMLILFEVFREAGMRLPFAVGQTLSVIGGLIIGDAAIRAGLTSPAMLVVIAASTIATFTLVNQTLIGVVSLVRFYIIIFVAIFGFFGFFVAIFILGTCIARVQSFGVPYLQLALRLSVKNTFKSLTKLPEQKNTKRQNSLNPQDETKQGGSP